MLLSPFSRTGDRKIDRDKLIYERTSPTEALAAPASLWRLAYAQKAGVGLLKI